jgi:hypothetical protein
LRADAAHTAVITNAELAAGTGLDIIAS